MSFSGYIQALCVNGHQLFWDVYDKDQFCYICNAKIQWSNLVDITNGTEDGLIDLVEIEPAKMCTCNYGYEHELEPAKFRLP